MKLTIPSAITLAWAFFLGVKCFIGHLTCILWMMHAKVRGVCDFFGSFTIGASGMFFLFMYVNPDDELLKTTLGSQNFNSAMVQFLQG